MLTNRHEGAKTVRHKWFWRFFYYRKKSQRKEEIDLWKTKLCVSTESWSIGE